ncbi:MAG TPA: ATP-binding protein [Actinospica sp.]|nr:ATP-binding protein [Actinospica sp.]
MPLRRKLDILVATPLVIILLLIAPVSYGFFHTASQWNTAAVQMSQAEQVNLLINALEIEQTVAVGLQGDSALADAPSEDSVRTLKAYAASTDQALAAVRHDLKPATSTALGQAIAEVVWETQGISGARATAMQPAADKSAAVETGYGTAIQELYNALDMDVLAENGGAAAFDVGELGSLFDADVREHNREIDLLAMTNQADLDRTAGGDTLDWPDLSAVERDYGVSLNEAERFEGVASPVDTNRFQAAVASIAQSYVDSEQQNVEEQLSSQNPAAAVDEVLLADQLNMPDLVGSNASVGLLQASVQSMQNRYTMEQQVSADVVAAAQREAKIQSWYALGLVAAAVLVLIILIVLEYRVRRSVVNPMLQLTEAATKIAEVTRADLERVADEDDPGDPQAVPVFEKVPVFTSDEVGKLAEAFNWVQDSAVRVLERQMAVRRNTAEMFGNVGRRIHNLTGRQLALIDAAEREETDPSVLERLYRIDHIAVRLQRGADSLMLLSGETEPALTDDPLRLTDVVRSAVGRVEGYQRVVLSAEGDVTVAPAAVGDLTLIVAELVENAVSFSPQTSSVDISVRPTIEGAYIEIVDHGVGMTTARLAEENARLVRRERLDLAPTKVLGLFVVGRLARRSGIAVRLTATSGGGVTVRLDIGSNLLFDAPQPPARRRGPAQASRTVRPGRPAALPEQRATVAEPTAPPRQAPQQPQPTEFISPPGADPLPVRRRSKLPEPEPAPTPEPLVEDAPPAHANGAHTNGDAVPAPAALPPTSADLARRIRAAAAAAPPAAPPEPTALQALTAPLLPRRRSAPDAESTDPAAPAGDSAATEPSPLPRRARNRSAVRESAPSVPAALADAQLLDAEAARAAVEEFEAGVEEALRASGTQELPIIRASDEPEGIRP